MAVQGLNQLLLTAGQTVGRFTIQEFINSGGYGQVFAAVDKATDRRVAIKVEPKSLSGSQLENESRILHQLAVYASGDAYALRRNDHILGFVQYGENDDIRYLIMERCGPNVRDLKKKTPEDRFSMYTSLWLMEKMISAVRYLHSLQFIHRDVKPNNFCIGELEQRHLYLIDYGLCRHVEHENKKTKSHFYGTVRYASPNAHMKKPLTKFDDLWSIYYGTVENMNGALPWRYVEDKDQVAKMKAETDLLKLDYGTPKPPSSLSCMFRVLQQKLTDPHSHIIPPDYNDILGRVDMDMSNRRLAGPSLLDWQPPRQKAPGAGDWPQSPPPVKSHYCC